jgi:hypothetical protein
LREALNDSRMSMELNFQFSENIQPFAPQNFYPNDEEVIYSLKDCFNYVLAKGDVFCLNENGCLESTLMNF